MAFAFRRLVSTNTLQSQEISDAAAIYSTKVEYLIAYGTIQAIKTVNPISGEILDYLAYKDPDKGDALIFKRAKDSYDLGVSDIAENSELASSEISGWVNSNYGDPNVPVFDFYMLYMHNDAAAACKMGTNSQFGYYKSYVYGEEVFFDEKGQELFNGGRAWYFVVDAKGNPTGDVWQIDEKGQIMSTYGCPPIDQPPMEEFM
jgi:hypothetical protein